MRVKHGLMVCNKKKLKANNMRCNKNSIRLRYGSDDHHSAMNAVRVDRRKVPYSYIFIQLMG